MDIRCFLTGFSGQEDKPSLTVTFSRYLSILSQNGGGRTKRSIPGCRSK
ncbi:hypothetical protein CLOSTASPAR_04896 [[Clostridium] asparagiforme DSM 15981]|uniref:Uncharacterized protein n=1 Tax=[Clostridium] asparagiforme DSM 15981 TaxID=518636 RepID=C0D6J9_9FIRM|nr:hypothetical protein CLOSTASPAR_04896 [[Clostridium] asparagiforme DSM 15981]